MIPDDLLCRAMQYVNAEWEQIVPEGSMRIPLYERPRPDGFNVLCVHAVLGSILVRMMPEVIRYLAENASGSWVVEHKVYVGACNSCGKHLHAMDDVPTVTPITRLTRSESIPLVL